MSRLFTALRIVLAALSLLGCEGHFGLEPLRGAPPPRLRDAGPGSDARAAPPADAYAPPGADAARCDPGDERTFSVYYGTREDSTLMLTPGQVLAIARLQGGGGLCSGTVIAPRWVLTAAHCAPAIGVGTDVSVGANPDSPEHRLTVRRAIRHPSIDLMLLELNEDATTTVPGLAPLPVYPGALDAFVGRTVEAAGYGRRENGALGARRFTAQPCVGVAGDYLSVDGMGTRGLCGGDSGGPVMIREGGIVYVLGALTGGDSSCVGVDNYTRVDLGRAFLESNVGAMPPPVDPCMGLTREGRCEGSTAVWCENGRVLRRECGRCGQSCAVDPGPAGAHCAG